MGEASARDRLAWVGDVHIEQDDPALDAFRSFLERLGARCRRVILMGDLFDLWIGRRELEQPHHAAVAGTLAGLRRAGVEVVYVEGNRDYRIADGYVGEALDASSELGREDRAGSRRFYSVHGDLVNVADRQYRAWRRLSRSAPFWAVFNLLPRGARLRLSRQLERRMRSTNLLHKRAFPEATVREFASDVFRQGYDALMLGHFHVEKDFRVPVEGREGRVLVLPEWKGSRRHLEAAPDGTLEWVDS
jgi:UDP-2,3-diacylglucosamine hydrolase